MGCSPPLNWTKACDYALSSSLPQHPPVDTLRCIITPHCPMGSCTEYLDYEEKFHFIQNPLARRAQLPVGHLTMAAFSDVFSTLHLFANYSLEKFGYSSQQDRTL